MGINQPHVKEFSSTKVEESRMLTTDILLRKHIMQDTDYVRIVNSLKKPSLICFMNIQK